MPQLERLKLEKFLPIFQVIHKADGTHSVLGVATSERVDKDDERAKFQGTLEQVKLWSAEFVKTTSSNGQDLSLGNIRVQHDPKQIGGKVTAINPEDAEKKIVIDTQPRQAVYDDLISTGMVTGFSIAGSYLERSCSECHTDMMDTRGNYCGKCLKKVVVDYVPEIAEISYVDNPCNPDAAFLSVKSNGSQELVKFADLRKETEQREAAAQRDEPLEKKIERIVLNIFGKDKKTKRVAGEDLTADCFAYVGDKDDPSTWKLPIKFSTDAKTVSHIRNALARFNQTQGIPSSERAKVKAKLIAAAKKRGIEVSEKSAKCVRFALVKMIALDLQALGTAEVYKTVDGALQAAEAIVAIVEEVLAKVDGQVKLFKGLYTVSQLAEILQGLQWIVASSEYEREYEGDDSEVPDDLRDALEGLVPIFIAMASEEAKELLNQNKKTANGGNGGTMSKLTADLLKAAQELWKKAASHFGKMSKAHSGLAKAHTKSADHHEAIADHLDGDGAMGKGIAKGHAGLSKTHVTKADHHDSLSKHCAAAAEDSADKAAKDELQKLAEGAEFKKLDPEAQFEKRMDVLIEKGGGCSKCFGKMAKGYAAISKLHKSLSDKHDDMNKAAIALGDAEEEIDMQSREKDDADAHPGGSSEKAATKEVLDAIKAVKDELTTKIGNIETTVAGVKADVEKMNTLEDGPAAAAKKAAAEKAAAGGAPVTDRNANNPGADPTGGDPSKVSTIKIEKTAGSAQGTVGAFA